MVLPVQFDSIIKVHVRKPVQFCLTRSCLTVQSNVTGVWPALARIFYKSIFKGIKPISINNNNVFQSSVNLPDGLCQRNMPR